MEIKERYLKALTKRLTHDQRELFQLVEVQQQTKDMLVYRMPTGLVSLEGVWETSLTLAKEMKVRLKQVGEFATLAELDDLLGDIDWLWNKWVPKGFVTMIAGDPGIGKSAVAQWLMKVVTEGSCYPLEPKPLGKSGTGVWVDTEASQQILKIRAETMKIDKGRIYIPVINGDILSQANLGFEKDRETIINIVDGVRPGLLVLDSLGGSHARGENKVEDIRPVLEFLALLARDKQIACIVIHHLNKGQPGEQAEVSLYRLRGSTIIPAMCRSIIAVEKSFDGNNKMRMIKNNLTKAPEPITIIPTFDKDEEITGFTFAPYVPPPPKKNKKEQCAEWLVSQLEFNKDGLSPKALEELGQGLFNRQNIYAGKDLLGDKLTISGTGNMAIWSVTQAAKNDNGSIRKILSSSNGKGNGHGQAKSKSTRK